MNALLSYKEATIMYSQVEKFFMWLLFWFLLRDAFYDLFWRYICEKNQFCKDCKDLNDNLGFWVLT